MLLRMKVLRQAQGFSQWDVTNGTGISQTKICLIEKGHVRATEAERAQIAAFLGATPETLFRSITVQRKLIGDGERSVVGV